MPPAAGLAKPLRTAPAVEPNGRIYLHVGGKLIGLEEQDGKPTVCWEYVTGSHAPGPVAMAGDGTLRLHTADGLLHCVNFDGKSIYSPVSVGPPLGYAAPLADDDGNTWICCSEGGLLAVDPDGKVAPCFRSRQKLDAPGIIRDGVLYVGSENGHLFAIRLGEGAAKNLWDHAAGRGCTGWFIHTAPALADDGTVIVAGSDEHLHGFASKGQPSWQTEMPGQLLGSPVIDREGQVYVGISQSRRGQSPRGLLVCVDGNSHRIRWEYKAAGPVESTPVIGDDDIVYFGDNAAMVHAVNFRGELQWKAELETAVRSAATILGPNRLAVGLDNETLVVLECSSKTLAEQGWPKIARTLGQSGTA